MWQIDGHIVPPRLPANSISLRDIAGALASKGVHYASTRNNNFAEWFKWNPEPSSIMASAYNTRGHCTSSRKWKNGKKGNVLAGSQDGDCTGGNCHWRYRPLESHLWDATSWESGVALLPGGGNVRRVVRRRKLFV